MKRVIHVNQHKIRRNQKTGAGVEEEKKDMKITP